MDAVLTHNPMKTIPTTIVLQSEESGCSFEVRQSDGSMKKCFSKMLVNYATVCYASGHTVAFRATTKGTQITDERDGKSKHPLYVLQELTRMTDATQARNALIHLLTVTKPVGTVHEAAPVYNAPARNARRPDWQRYRKGGLGSHAGRGALAAEFGGIDAQDRANRANLAVATTLQ
jgi:hypothetical protein